jgi:signal transduction histidine kinase
MYDHEDENLELDSILSEVIELVKPTIDKGNISLSVESRCNPQLNVDSDLLKQVILNLVVNAIESMPGGGSLEIACDNREIDKRKYTIVEFKDNGPGIQEGSKEHIFEPFYSTKDSSDNKGLGLSLSKDIMEQFGGFITAESDLEVGATFRIFIPTD